MNPFFISRMSKAMWEAMAVEMQSEIEESWLKDEVYFFYELLSPI